MKMVLYRPELEVIRMKKKGIKYKVRILATYLLILGLSGTYVYADDPENPGVIQENSSENTSDNPGEGSSENTGNETEESTEKETENTEQPTQGSTEKKTENTEQPSENTTEKTEQPTENQEQTSETGSTEGTSADLGQLSTFQALPYTEYLDANRVAQLRTKYAENMLASQETRTFLNNLKRNQNSFIENLQQMDEEIISLQSRMDQMEEDRKLVDATLSQLETELELAEQDVQTQYQKLKEHIQNSYENGTYSYLDALLYAADFADVLNRTEYVQQVSLYDSLLLVRYQSSRQQLANKMAMLKTMTEDYGVMQTYYKDQQEALVLLSNEKEKEILAFQPQIDEKQQELTKLQLLQQQEANEIARIEAEARMKANAAAAAAAAASQGQGQGQRISIPQTLSRDPIIVDYVPYNGEAFIWPQPSSTKITSDYGWRGDIGIPGASADHKGIDIAANLNDPLVAAAGGKVIFVGYYGTGGNTVMIDIGQGITIIYHHLNAYAVVKGDTVKAGQVVGFAGETGVARGVHLHFSVRLNGQYVNPWPFLSGTN